MEAPNTPSIIIAMADFDPTGTVLRANAIKAKIPPSPLLLARMINITYLKETTISPPVTKTVLKNTTSNIPETIRKVREYKKLSVEQFANRLGVTKSTVYRWETGVRNPTQQNLAIIAEMTKVKR